VILKTFKFAKPAIMVAALASLPLVCLAQNKPEIVPQLPAIVWRLANSKTLPLAAVSEYGGDPVIEHEYGVKQLELRTYQLGSKQAQVVVEPAEDTTEAYGLLTFYQTPSMAEEDGIQLAVSSPDETLMARGSNFLRFLHGKNDSATDKERQALFLFVGGSKPSGNALKTLPLPMPPQALIHGTEKYLLGLEAAKRVLPDLRTDLLGFEQSAEVQLGRYKTPQGAATLISIYYPTPQIARIRFGSLSSFLGVNQPKGDASIYGVRRGSYAFLVLNARNPETANGLLNLFQVTQGISWDQKYVTERSFTLQLVHMILAIFLLIAILLGACLLFGVVFFLSRRLAARFFPNSLWGRSDEDQLIRLNIKLQ
jgi:hypothetical protein